jgi:putative redox protein
MAKQYEAAVEWVEADVFRAVGPSGHAVVFDGAAPDGPSRGPSPVEALLLAFGACDGINVVSVLRKMRQEVTGYSVRLRGERRDEPPRVFTRIEVEHEVRGRGLDAEKAARAVELSAKYCSVGATLRVAAEVVETVRVVEEAG